MSRPETERLPAMSDLTGDDVCGVSGWIEVALLDSIPRTPGLQTVRIAGTQVVLCPAEDGVRAVGAHCPHFRAPMADGWVDHERIVCPWHLWEFDLETGLCEYAPAEDPYFFYSGDFTGEYTDVRLPVYQCKTEGGGVFLHLDSGKLTPSARL